MNDNLVVLTKSQLSDLVEEAVKKALNIVDKKEQDDVIVYGVKGIAQEIGVSVSTAQRWLSEGVFEDAVFYVGRGVRAFQSKLWDKFQSHQDERYVHQFKRA